MDLETYNTTVLLPKLKELLAHRPGVDDPAHPGFRFVQLPVLRQDWFEHYREVPPNYVVLNQLMRQVASSWKQHFRLPDGSRLRGYRVWLPTEEAA